MPGSKGVPKRAPKQAERRLDARRSKSDGKSDGKDDGKSVRGRCTPQRQTDCDLRFSLTEEGDPTPSAVGSAVSCFRAARIEGHVRTHASRHEVTRSHIRQLLSPLQTPRAVSGVCRFAKLRCCAVLRGESAIPLLRRMQHAKANSPRHPATGVFDFRARWAQLTRARTGCSRCRHGP